MIDFHSHILPGIDDGSKDPEMTAKMLSLAYQQGVEHMVATPHFYGLHKTVEQFLQLRQAALETIRWDGQTMPQIHLGAEVAYFPNMSQSEALQQLQIDDSRLLLVEMPFSKWSDRVVEDVCRLQDRQGLTPVLAHVERYRHRTQFPKYRDRLLAAGALFQCNGEAFLQSGTKGWALKMLKRGYVQFLGSDCHNLENRGPNLDLAARIVEKKLGNQALAELADFSKQALNL